MQYFTVRAKSHWEAVDKMKARYGPSARVLTHRNVRFGGFLGLFRNEGVEITCYIANETGKRADPLEEEKRKILESVGKNQTMQLILREIQAIKKALPRERVREDSVGSKSHSTIKKIRELLLLNEFTESYTERIIKRVKAEFSLEALDDLEKVQSSVLEWIGEGIKIFTNGETRDGKARIIAIIGPTGVGKTTTVAKLAAIYGLENRHSPPLQVRMVTIDNYKIAAKKQIETYAEIMQIPVSYAESRSDLEKILDLYRDVDVVLIDTIGKSPNDFEKLGEMQSVLNACGSESEIHLAISATTKTSDIVEILRQFEPFKYISIILTKLDETYRIGNIISILSEYNKPLSYITDGQMVPQDIEPASVSRLLMNLEGFRTDKEQIERKFGRNVVDTKIGW
jgi:flagellar biosynthesis protein FlhF